MKPRIFGFIAWFISRSGLGPDVAGAATAFFVGLEEKRRNKQIE